jgi:hypothetical protein
METINNKKQLVILLHLLFWILSFNLFNSFFSRGIESGYMLDGLELTGWNVLFISNLILLILLTPIVWLIKGLNRWIKWGVTALSLIFVVWGILIMIFSHDNFIPELIGVYFIDNFLYVLIFHITIIAAVYRNFNVLINKYLIKGKFGRYLVSALGLAVVAGSFNYLLFNWCIDMIFPKLYFISWFKIEELILIVIGYLAVTTGAYLVWQYATMLIANREKAQNELSALKAQINPHFLFNNLNTIYAMAEKGDLRTKEVILQLSDFLRYVLYDTSSERIELEKEIEIIKTYVGLQRERINKETTEIILTIEGDFTGVSIAPLLLLPLAENCFKHGVGKDKGTIQIDIQYSGNQLRFSTKNPIERRENPLSNGQGGIGIINVEKRLNLLYPGKYHLKFSEVGNLFNVDMQIYIDQTT